MFDFNVWERTELYFAREVGHPPDEFGKNLEADGYTKSTSRDGNATNYTKGDRTYSVYSKSASTGEPSAQLRVQGEGTVAKIRLK